MIGDYFSLAIGNLKHRGIRSWLTMLGIFIGIAAVVSLISLGQGLQTAVTGQFSTLSADRLIVTNAETGFGPPGSTAVKKLTDHDIDIIKGIDGIDSVIPRLLRVVKVEYNKAASFEFAASMPEKKEDIDLVYSSFNINLDSGNLIKEGDKGVVVLGHDFEETSKYGKDIRVGTNLIIQGKSFEVIGILKKASTFQINGVILIPQKDLEEILKIDNEYDIIAVKVENKDEVSQVADEIRRKLRKDRNEKEGEEDFSVQEPVQALSSINTILNIINLIVGGIAGISLLIGSIGITNTMYTSVLERTKEIGVMKALGAQNKDILLIFLIESGLLGLVGGLVGTAIGLGLAFAASGAANAFFEQNLIEVTYSWPFLISAVLFSFIIGTIAGVLPAYQASRLKPTEALRQ